MNASASKPASSAERAGGEREFDLVESSAGWRLTVTLTDRLREMLAGSTDSDEDRNVTVRISPNLVPGDAFDVTLSIREPDDGSAAAGGDAGSVRRPSPAG